MKVNTKTRYGLRVMIEVAASDGMGGILQKEVSEKQKISYKYLDQIIAGLKSAGLIATVSGKKSGYKLKKSASEITAYDVYKAFNHDVEIADCVDPSHDCEMDGSCATKDFWHDLNNVIKEKLISVTLLSLLEKYENEKQESYTYQI